MTLQIFAVEVDNALQKRAFIIEIGFVSFPSSPVIFEH